MTAAIHYAPDGYITARQDLKGRHAAGYGFLRGMARWSQGPLLLAARNVEEARQGLGLVAADLGDRPVGWLPLERMQALRPPSGPGCLFTPGPVLAALARTRQRLDGGAGWSLCGVTHTTASARAMEALSLSLLTAPLEPWDAVICTSSVVRATVQRMLEALGQDLHQRLGASRFVVPQLPVIPLGVHCDDYAGLPELRPQARAALGIAPADVALLFVGRMSFHGKANPLPLYLAAQRVAETLPPGRTLHLLEAGWYGGEMQVNGFAQAAATLMPDVRRQPLEGRNPDTLRSAWAAADVFVSLSDNVQETFGLTPVEAMAAGLPVVVTDWDGYRDTVRDGVDGIRVPTLMLPGGLGENIALRYDLDLDSYDQYCGTVSQSTAVDTGAVEQALRALVLSPELRRRMGQAGQQRARQTFDWKTVIGQYEALWAALAERRRAAADKPRQAPPLRLDPFALFAGYPSGLLRDDLLVTLGPDPDPLAAFRQRRALTVAAIAPQVPPTEAEAAALFARLRAGPLTVGTVLAETPPDRQAALAGGLVWLMKADLIRIRASS